MPEARRESPLVGFHSEGQKSTDGGRAVLMTERRLYGYINLRGDAWDDSFIDAVSSVLGSTVPTYPNTIVHTDDLTICWLGPDEWMAIVGRKAESEITANLRNALGDLHAAVTHITGGYTLVNLGGSQARQLLAKGCSLDLHPRAFAPGQCAQTNLAKTTILLISRSNESHSQSVDIVVRRSFADYLASWIEHSAREYGLEIVRGEA